MAEVTWKNLAKDVGDLTKISDEINSKILEHNNDPSAHSQSNEALYNHRTGEILDHLDKSVSVEKLNWDRFLCEPTFESLDAWNTEETGAGALVFASVGVVMLRCGSAIGDITRLWNVSYPILPVGELDPFFQNIVKVDDDALTDADWGFACGSDDPLESPNGYLFGFKYLETDEKFYAFYHYYDGSAWVEVKTEITGIILTDPNAYRAELIYDSSKPAGQRQTLKFYVNGELILTAADIDFSMDNEVFWSSIIKTKGGGGGFSIYVAALIFSQNYG